MEKAKNTVIEFLEAIAIPISHHHDYDTLYQVAMVASNYDEEISKIIADAIHTIGPYGKINIEPHKLEKTELKLIEGGSILRGYAKASLKKNITDTSIDFEDPYIVTLDVKIKEKWMLRKLLELAKKLDKPLVILCQQIDNSFLSQIAFNIKNDVVKVNVIEFPRLPHTTENELLEDLAVLFNCKYYHEFNLDDFRDITTDDLGTARQIVSNEVETSFEGKINKTKEHEQRIKERIEMLNYQSYSGLLIRQ